MQEAAEGLTQMAAIVRPNTPIVDQAHGAISDSAVAEEMAVVVATLANLAASVPVHLTARGQTGRPWGCRGELNQKPFGLRDLMGYLPGFRCVGVGSDGMGVTTTTPGNPLPSICVPMPASPGMTTPCSPANTSPGRSPGPPLQLGEPGAQRGPETDAGM